jgi:hypothetical protein
MGRSEAGVSGVLERDERGGKAVEPVQWLQWGQPMQWVVSARRNWPPHFAAVIHMSCAKTCFCDTLCFEISEVDEQFFLEIY